MKNHYSLFYTNTYYVSYRSDFRFNFNYSYFISAIFLFSLLFCCLSFQLFLKRCNISLLSSKRKDVNK